MINAILAQQLRLPFDSEEFQVKGWTFYHSPSHNVWYLCCPLKGCAFCVSDQISPRLLDGVWHTLYVSSIIAHLLHYHHEDEFYIDVVTGQVRSEHATSGLPYSD